MNTQNKRLPAINRQAHLPSSEQAGEQEEGEQTQCGSKISRTIMAKASLLYKGLDSKIKRRLGI